MTQAFDKRAAGFSIIELIIALAITLSVMGIATTLVTRAFSVRHRESQRTDALADAQRALNLMSREIASAGFGTMDNGLVATDTGLNMIRFRADLNSNGMINGIASESDEDVKYSLFNDTTVTPNRRYLLRRDVRFEVGAPSVANQTMIFADIDAINIRYYRQRVSYNQDLNTCDITGVTPATVTIPNGNTTVTVSNEVTTTPTLADYVVISICVEVPASGSQNAGSFQPRTRMQLVSDVNLRNAGIINY